MERVWCVLVMLNDSYAVGAAVVAKTLRLVGTRYPIWCMHDNSVSLECIDFLRSQFDHVVQVPLIQHEVIPMKSKKQIEIYGSWIHASFTKWNIFNPEFFPVDKVILLDADMMFLENCDHLFELTAPALTFSSPWARPYKHEKGAYNPFGELKHGQVVPREKIIQSFKKGILGLACMVLVQPSTELAQKCHELLHKNPQYGHPGCIAGFDEQLLSESLLSMNIPIYHIHQQYNWIVGKYNWLLHGETPKTQQCYNGKPWQGITVPSDRKKIESSWLDFRQWWDVADLIMMNDPSTVRWFYPGTTS